MAKENISEKSLREHVLESIGNFLYKEDFPNCNITPSGILNLIDLISNYQEEGKELYPEILLTTDFSKLIEALPFARRMQIAYAELTLKEFSRALKLCAPLAIDGWVIYLQIKDSEISYGLVSSELSEISPSFYRQVVGDLEQYDDDATIAYIKNIGNKTVLLEGKENKLIVSLSLQQVSVQGDSNITELCRALIQDLSSGLTEISMAFFEKLINDSVKDSHGTLIGVVKDREDSLSDLKTKLKDGAYLEDSIDIISYLKLSEDEKTRQASTSVRVLSSLIKSMLNHDGISVFTTKGRLLGYHCFIASSETSRDDVVGGARSRAFEAMKMSGLFCCCFYKSQDGNELIWRK
ncbi:MAG: hypothetical protein GY749_02995 [Desulfobacteraceae bacterium]|nr:hypothetical protein [Desulfobacteraceae bacterium]